MKRLRKILSYILSLSFVISNAQNNETAEQYKYGFVNVKIGKEITPLKYDMVYHFKNGMGTIRLDGKYGSVNKEGKEIIPAKYDSVFDFSNGVIKVMLDKKYGAIDIEGNEITKIKYDEVKSYNNGLIKVRLNKKYGIVNNRGKEISPIKYDEISVYKYIIVVKDEGKYGALDLYGRELTPLIYDEIRPISYIDDSLPLYVIGYNEKYGLINEKFEKVTAIKYDKIFRSNGAISVKVNGKYGFLNQQGQETTEIKYEQIRTVENIGKVILTPAMVDNKWSFFNDEGKEVFPVQYDDYQNLGFSSSVYKMMKVSNKSKWGCVNEKLLEVVPPRYDDISFSQLSGNFDVIVVKLKDKLGVFDMQGNELVAVECDEVDVGYTKFIYFKINSKWGVKDKTGKQILQPKYQEIESLYFNNLFTVKRNSKWGVVNGADQIVIPIKYDKSLFYSSNDSRIIGRLKNKRFFFDEVGNVIFKEKIVKYKSIFPYDHGLISCGNFENNNAHKRKIKQITSDFIKVKKNDRWIFTDNGDTEVILPIQSDNWRYYSKEDIATVKVKVD